MVLNWWLVLTLYGLGLLLFVAMLLYSLIEIRRRKNQRRGDESSLFEPIGEVKELDAYESRSVPLVETSRLSMAIAHKEFTVNEVHIAELAMDINVAVLEATRGQERKLSKSQAEELLLLIGVRGLVVVIFNW